MIETLIAGSAGFLMGVVAGILPGLGTVSLLTISYFFISGLEPANLIIYYLGILMASQYFGSVTAITTGIPGDTSALPAAQWGFDLSKKGQAGILLYLTAKFSLIAGVLGFVAFLLIISLNWFWVKTLSIWFQTLVLTIAFITILFVSTNKKIINLLMIVAGILIGLVGYSFNYQREFLTWNVEMLKFGIPWLPILTGLIVVPGLMSLLKTNIINIDITSTHRLPQQKSFAAAAARGGIFGFILGTVPGLSYILSSMISAKIEERVSQDPQKIVVASESANNAGAVSMLLPLFLVGVPITASESVIFSILTTNFDIGNIPELFRDKWVLFTVYFLLLNLCLFVTAWKFAIPISNYLLKRTRILFVFAIVLVLFGVFYMGYVEQDLMLYLLTLIVFTVAGVLFSRLDWTPLVYAVLLQPYAELCVHKFFQVYF